MVRRVINTAFVLTCTHSRISRTPYHPIGGGMLPQGTQNSVSSPLSPQRKLRSPKLKYEALEISEVRGPLEKKSAYALQLLWAPLNARYLHITTAVGDHFESKVAYLYNTVAVGPPWKNFRHYSCNGWPEASASLAFPSTHHCVKPWQWSHMRVWNRLNTFCFIWYAYFLTWCAHVNTVM